MAVPPQGVRHAVLLLLSGAARRLSAEDSPADTTDALTRVADDLVALAEDMRAPADTRDWLGGEYQRTIAALPARFDRERVTRYAAAALDRLGASSGAETRRDLFLIYAPEDRLPIAAPLAVELTKRGVTVAFSEYEVADRDQARTRLERGLRVHRAGAILATPVLERTVGGGLPQLSSPFATDRLIVISDPSSTSIDALVKWIRSHSV